MRCDKIEKMKATYMEVGGVLGFYYVHVMWVCTLHKIHTYIYICVCVCNFMCLCL